MIIDPLPNEHRDIFHGPTTETNLELHFKGSNAKKAFDILKQHPKHIVSLSLYYEQGVNAIIGHLIVKMHCTTVIKTLEKLTSFDKSFDKKKQGHKKPTIPSLVTSIHKRFVISSKQRQLSTIKRLMRPPLFFQKKRKPLHEN